MTPDRFAEILDFLDLSRRRLAANENYHPRLVRRWQQGTMVIPAVVADWLEAVMAEAQLDPRPPEDAGPPEVVGEASMPEQEDVWLEAIIGRAGPSPDWKPDWAHIHKNPVAELL